MNGDIYRYKFKFNGAFHEIYVLNTCLSDWQCLIDFIRAGAYKFSYTQDGAEAALPEQVTEIFRIRNDEASADMWLYVGSVVVGCHFFDESEIVFDLDPRDVKSNADADGVLEFMCRIGELLDKEVILTEECSSVEMALNEVIFKFSLGFKQIQYVWRDN